MSEQIPPPPPPPPPGGYSPGGAAVAVPKNDTLAIVSLVAGILGLCCWILAPVAAITGFMSRNRIKASGGTLGGGTLATIGLVLGIVGIVLLIGYILLIVLGVMTAPGATSTPVPYPT